MHLPTKENIQAALLSLLGEGSMYSVTVKEVARRAGVSRQTVYNHYYCPWTYCGTCSPGS